jgi:hypothetical protein
MQRINEYKLVLELSLMRTDESISVKKVENYYAVSLWIHFLEIRFLENRKFIANRPKLLKMYPFHRKMGLLYQLYFSKEMRNR